MRPGDWDPVAISKALRAIGVDLDPSYWLDPPACTGPGRYAVDCIGRMCFEPIGTKEVHWTGTQWSVAKGWLNRVNAPTGETVFDEKLSGLAK